MAYEVYAPHNDQFPTLLSSFPLYCAVSNFIVFLHLGTGVTVDGFTPKIVVLFFHGVVAGRQGYD